jgi:two-component system, NtrC family, sensor kinase
MSKTEKNKDRALDDVTALRREIVSLREGEKRFRALINNLPVGVYRRTCGTDGRVLMANRAFLDMFGYSTVDEVGTVPVAQMYWDPSECASFSEGVVSHGELVKEEHKMKTKAGVPLWVAITATLLCDESGQPAFVDGIMEDITARKRAEKDAALRQQQLAQADKMISLGILVSGVAHEINNPNQFIVSHTAPLKRAWEDALPILDRYYEDHGDFLLGGRTFSVRRNQIAEMIASILSGSQRIKHIVDELRDYARERPVELAETMYLNNVVKSALALLSNLIKKSTKHFSVVYGENMPLISGDYQRIEQVLINLIQNSCQALPDADSEVLVRTTYDADANAVVAEVRDTGKGIPAEDIERIKDPFFTSRRTSGGTGLGLSVSASIVEKHGGTLTFASKLGEGTTARISLPVADAE